MGNTEITPGCPGERSQQVINETKNCGRVVAGRPAARTKRLTGDLGGGGGVEVGREAVDVLGVRVEDRLPRLLLAALHDHARH